MIFLTVGSQLPFDRMVRLVDGWAKDNPSVKVIAQVGRTDYVAHSLECFQDFSPKQYALMIESCSVVIAHAGMGSILTALRYGKPIVAFPRRGELMETRNDHQVATARALEGRKGIHIAFNEASLVDCLDLVAFSRDEVEPIAPVASDGLINGLRTFFCSAE